MVEYRKVKDGNRKGNRNPKTEKQLEASRKSGLKVMLTKNPMYNPKSLNKLRKSLKKGLEKRRKNPIFQKNLFKKGNQFGKLRKNRKISEEQKIKQSMKMMGRKTGRKMNETLIRMIIFNHPMRNPEFLKKYQEARRLKLPEEVLNKVIKEFQEGKSITQLVEELKINCETLSKLLKRNGIKFTHGERISIYNKINPKIINTQFKKGEKHGTPFRKGYKQTEEEKEMKRRKDIIENTDKIIEMYNQNICASKIAKQFNTTHNTILSLLRRKGIEIRPQREYILGDKNPSRILYNKKCKEVKDGENKFIDAISNPTVACN